MATLLLPKAPRNNLDIILGYRMYDMVSSIRKITVSPAQGGVLNILPFMGRGQLRST